MSNYIDKYKNRLRKKGENVGEVYDSNTIAFIEKTFKNSPTYRLLEVSSYELPDVTTYDARVVDVERMGNLKEILFRPKQGLKIGTYVTFDSATWLIFDSWGTYESTYSKALAQKCNSSLKWKDNNGILQEVKCIASAQPIGSKANQGKLDIFYNKYDVTLPSGQLYVYTEFNDLTEKINLNQRFIFGKQVYEIYGIDTSTTVEADGFGIIQLLVRLTTKQDEDNFEERIAKNKYDSEPIQNGNDNGDTDDGEDGGLLW